MKRIFIIKREDIFPKIENFNKINERIWEMGFLKILRRLNGNEVIVTDYQTKLRLEKYGINSKIFGEYLEGYDNKYPEAIKKIRKWFDSFYFRKIKMYKGIDLGLIREEIFAYFLEEVLDYVEVTESILRKEKPSQVVIVGELGLFNKSIKVIAKKGGIQVEEALKLGSLRKIIYRITKRASFSTKFSRFPRKGNKEFVKTKEQVQQENKGKVMILGLDQTYFNRLGNIPEELIRKGEGFFVLSTNSEMQKALKEKKIEYYSFGDFIDLKTKKDLRKKRKELIKYWNVLKKNPGFRKMFMFHTINLFQIIQDYLEDLIKNGFTQVMYYLEASEKCFREKAVKIVVSIDDAIPPTRSIVSLAKKKMIPSLIIQNGIIADPTGHGFAPLIGDKFAAWGKMSRDFMIKKGTEAKKIVITGNPQFNELRKRKIDDEFYKKSGLDKSKKTIILATQAFGDLFSEKELSELTKQTILALKNSKERQLVIKIHPRESPELYESIVKETGAKNVLIMKENLEELISICEALITINSTVALDALSINKPVIIANFFNRPCAVPYVDSGATTRANSKEELTKVLKNLKSKSNKKSKERFIYDCIYKRDNKAGGRIINLIKKMIKNGKYS